MVGPIPLVFAELITGDRVSGLACLWSCQVRQTRNGKSFFQLEFRDQASTILPGVMWDVDPGEVYECPMVVVIDGECGEFQGSKQIKVFTIRTTRDDVSDYLPSTYRPGQDLVDEFYGLIEMITDDELRRLVNSCLEAAPGFWTAPAAINFHGAYRGGLLEHTLHVMRFALHAADIYGQRVNQDLLIAGAALHDIGKSDAYDGPESRQPTEPERLVGHIVRGTMLVERVATEIDYNGSIPIEDVLHPIVSHHGELEFGSPIKPGTAEALIISGADTLDADVTGYFDLWRDKADNEQWTHSKRNSRWVRKPAVIDRIESTH
jgi:3'-5' exoribonuclease